MPVVPPFSTFAPAPNLAQSFLGQQRLQQEAADAAARIQLGYAQLRQRAVENEMELAAKKELNAQENLRKAQEDEIQKAYQQAQLGIAENRLQQAEQITKMRLSQAASQFAKDQAYARYQAEGEAAARAAGKTNPEQEGARYALFKTGQPGVGSSFREPSQSSTVAALNFELRRLGDEEKALNPLGRQIENLAPDVRDRIQQIQRARSELKVPPGLLNTATGNSATTAEPAPQSWLVPPETIPYGNPKNPSMFIGAPGGTNLAQFPEVSKGKKPGSKLFYNLKTQKFE